MCSNPYAWAKFLHSVDNELWPIVCVATQGYAVAGEEGFGEIREFSNSDGNKNVKKAIVLKIKLNNSARALHFFVHFFAVTARPLDVKFADGTFYRGHKLTTTKFCFSF